MVQMTVNMNDEMLDAIESISAQHGVSKTEVVAQAIVNYAWLKEQESKGMTLLVDRPRRGLRRSAIYEIIFP